MIRQWIRNFRAHRAALFLNRCRIERERRDRKAVARQIRRELGLPDDPRLAG